MISRYMKDKVALLKQNGERFNEIKALVQATLIIIEDVSLPIEEGDLLIRELPNGLTEKFRVEDRGYTESPFSASSFEPHYQVKVRREGATRENIASVTYNLTGTHSRVNIHSQDHSTNTSNITTENVFADLRQAIQTQINNQADVERLTKKLEELEQTKGAQPFIQKYQEFMTLAANHMTVIAPFIPALSLLLPS